VFVRCLLLICIVAFSSAVMAAQSDDKGAAVYATVAGKTITVAEFRATMQAGMRQRFFHGKVPDAQRERVRAELSLELFDRLRLIREAKNRQIKPDVEQVEADVQRASKRFQHDTDWQGKQSLLLSGLRQTFEENSLIDQLREAVSHVSADSLTEQALREYYQSHAEKFTTPERIRASLILLSVDPWAPAQAWRMAEEEALRLLEKIEQGQASFAELANLHSADASASRGGDLGFVHKGMLAEEAQQLLDGMKLGQLSRPLRLLKGFAIFRLDERTQPKLNPFEKIRERAQGLLKRQKQASAWSALLESLRAQMPVLIARQLKEDE